MVFLVFDDTVNVDRTFVPKFAQRLRFRRVPSRALVDPGTDPRVRRLLTKFGIVATDASLLPTTTT